jgi:hypothetical protein
MEAVGGAERHINADATLRRAFVTRAAQDARAVTNAARCIPRPDCRAFPWARCVPDNRALVQEV